MPSQGSRFGAPFPIFCALCGKRFVVSTADLSRRYPRRYCSKTCYFAVPRVPRPKMPRVTVNCGTCGIPMQILPSRIKSGEGRYCSRVCAITGSRQPIAFRLARDTDRSSVDGCWPWTGWIDPDGYGRIQVNGKCVAASRVAFTLASGITLTPDDIIGHTCDTPICTRNDGKEGVYLIESTSYVRFGHLFLTNRVGNRRDCVLKGRHAQGDRSKARLYPGSQVWGPEHPWRLNPELVLRGSKHGSAKITESKVLELRAAHAQGMSAKELAETEGMQYSNVWRIVTRRAWKHI